MPTQFPQKRHTQLHDLFDLDLDSPDWTEQDLRTMWNHQLDSPIERMMPVVDHQLHQQIVLLQPPTARTLLHMPSPPRELLLQLKNAAKIRRAMKNPPVPEALSLVLYYAVVVASKLHGGGKISDLADSELAKGVRIALSEPWLDESSRELFVKALSTLAG
jgi:hypothetical protein